MERPQPPRPRSSVSAEVQDGDWKALSQQLATVATGLYQKIPQLDEAVVRIEAATVFIGGSVSKLEAALAELRERLPQRQNGERQNEVREKHVSAHEIAEELRDVLDERDNERDRTNPGLQTVTTDVVHQVVETTLTKKELEEAKRSLARVWKVAFIVLGFISTVLAGILVWDLTLRGH